MTTRVSFRTGLCGICFVLALIGSSGVARGQDTNSTEAGGTTPVPVVIERAEDIRWNRGESRLTATGDVTVDYGSTRLRADTIHYYRSEDRLEGFGSVRVESPERGLQTGRRVSVDLTTNELSITDVRGKRGPWYISGPRLEGDADTEMRMPDGQFTTCNLRVPHYTIQTDQVYIYPGESIHAYGATMNVGSVPVLYLPYAYVNLRDKVSRWYVRPGYGSEEGAEMIVNYHYLLPSDSGPYTSTIYTDVRSKSGAGAGFDVGYSEDGNDAYFYGFFANRRPTEIEEDGDETRADTTMNLWRVRSDVDYDFEDSGWSAQANVDWIKNNRFNKDLQSSFDNRGIDRRRMNGSLVHSGDRSIFRFDVIREDRSVSRGDQVVFRRQREVLPRLQYQLFSLPVPRLGRGVFYGMNSTLENRRNGSNERSWEGTFSQNLTKSLPLTRNLGQSYRLGYEQRLREVTGTREGTRATGIGSFGLNNSYYMNRYSTLNLDYTLARQMNRRDSVPLTLQGVDLGTEEAGLRTHRLGLDYQVTFDRFSGTFQTGYDLRESDRFRIRPDSRVLSPQLSLRSRVTPRLNWTQYLRYSWRRDVLQQSSTSLEFDWSRDFSLSFGANYNRRASGDDFMKLTNGWTWESENRQWGARGDVIYDQGRTEFEEINLMLRKRLHKWDFRVYFQTIRDRERKIFFTFNLIDYPSQALGLSADIANPGVDFERGETSEYTP